MGYFGVLHWTHWRLHRVNWGCVMGCIGDVPQGTLRNTRVHFGCSLGCTGSTQGGELECSMDELGCSQLGYAGLPQSALGASEASRV